MIACLKVVQTVEKTKCLVYFVLTMNNVKSKLSKTVIPKA